jgi:hypothetical protein
VSPSSSSSWLARLAPAGAVDRYQLLPFTENETCAYVRHRMATAGGSREVFDVELQLKIDWLVGRPSPGSEWST